MTINVGHLRRGCLFVLTVLVLVACRPGHARYMVTATPIDVGIGTGLCLAVDPSDQHGIWWWQPGAAGCASRSTGPGVFHAAKGRVSTTVSGTPTSISFRLGTHSTTRPFIDLELLVENASIRALNTGATATLERRSTLDVPEVAPRRPAG
jgi:hypothetical protein